MNKYRFLPTCFWSDDITIGMSPEQKLIYIYLYTSPYTSLCGIFNLSISTMGHFVGIEKGRSITNAFRAFLLAYPDLVKYDEGTGEVAILYWPKYALVNANIKAKKKAESDLSEVRSIFLLKEVIRRNSATLSKMYLSRLRQLQIEKLNADRLLKSENYIDVAQSNENQELDSQREIVREIEIENTLSDSERIEPSTQLGPLKETGTGNPVESSAAAPNSAPAEDEFPFQSFWDAYDHKVGRAKTEKKWNRLSKKDRREAMRVVGWYVKDTVKDDSEQHGNVWRPRRQNPLTWLNGPGWADYADAGGPRIKDRPVAHVSGTGSRFQAPRPTIPAGYAKNERLDISALPD